MVVLKQLAGKSSSSSGSTTQGAPAKQPNKATAADVAKAAGVSTATVSRALHSGGIISDQTRSRILATARALGYQPNSIARGLAAQQNSLVGLVAGDITNPFYPEIIERLTKRFTEVGLHTMLVSMIDGVPIEETLSPLLQYRVQSAVFVAAPLTSSGCQLCAENGITPYLFNRHLESSDTMSVACDNHAGGKLVANLFLDAGHRQLAYVGGRVNTSTNSERLAGFSEIIAARKAAPCIVEQGGVFSYDAGYRATLRLLAGHPGIDAIFCANDIIALGTLDALRHELGRRVPADVSVVGFDDISSAAWPPYDLTTIRQPVDSMIDAVVSAIANPRAAGYGRGASPVLFPGTLVVRSTAKLTEVVNGSER